ncbi:MAG: class I SAM-dependent methyltransferase [Candidatus Woesearchaeota archaeon]|jgi:ubiquinone/menaquinone biosynthesis C-methylase UbiE
MIDDKYGLIDSLHVELFEDLLRKYGSRIVLDLGCGPRNPLGNKADLVKKLICVDGSEYVKEQMKKEKLPENSSFVFGDITNLPFKDNYAKLVLMLGIYTALPPKKLYVQSKNKFSSFQEYVANSQSMYLKEAHRVLKPRGFLIASLRDSKEFTIASQVRAFSNYFDVLNVYEGERYLLEAINRK